MRSTYFNVLFRYTLALIFAMFLKVLIIDISSAYETEKVLEESAPLISSKKEIKLEYKEVNVNDTLKKPLFNVNTLDNFTDTYIEINACDHLEYDVYELGMYRVNVFLNCGNPENIIYDYKEHKTLKNENLFDDYSSFLEKSKELLKLKYPSFVVDNIDFNNAKYDIKSQELIGFYTSQEYGNATYHINYNEIKDLFNFDVTYENEYTNEVYTLDPTKPTIAFSFDDGPSNYDLDLIRLLEESHSTATFFIVGNRISSFENVVSKLANSKMEIGNHTYDHKSLAGLSNEKILEQINKTNHLYNDKTGKTLKLLRPSYGAVNKRVLVQVGMPVILWNVDTLDWKTRDATKVYDEIMKSSNDGSIVLMHSLYQSTVDAVEKSLKELYKKGFQVVSVSELANLKGKTLEMGSSYTNIK